MIIKTLNYKKYQLAVTDEGGVYLYQKKRLPNTFYSHFVIIWAAPHGIKTIYSGYGIVRTTEFAHDFINAIEMWAKNNLGMRLTTFVKKILNTTESMVKILDKTYEFYSYT